MTPERLSEARYFIGTEPGMVGVIARAVLADRDHLAAEVDQLQGQLDRLQRVLLAEWEKDSENYRRLMQLVGESNSELTQ